MLIERADIGRGEGEQLLSHVSHEMRTPLNVVHQFVSIVLDGLDGPLSAQQRSHLQTALDNVNQLRVVIGDLLDVGQIERGAFSVDPCEVDAAQLAYDVIESLVPSADQAGLSLALDVEDDLPPCWADPARFRQVLTNLLDNAMTYTPEGGRVTAQVTRSPDHSRQVEIAVQDTGIGIPATEVSRVFDRMVQGTNPTQSGRKGLGLGLYICRELVESLGGQISVESEEGRGSRFAFTVPVASSLSKEQAEWSPVAMAVNA